LVAIGLPLLLLIQRRMRQRPLMIENHAQVAAIDPGPHPVHW
jgi:hypothetical protein